MRASTRRHLDLERLVGDRRRALLVVALCLLAVAPMMWLGITTAGSLPGDSAVARWAKHRPASERFNDVAYFFGSWAALPVALAVTVLGAWIAGRRMAPRYGVLVFVVALAAPVNEVLRSSLTPPPLATEFFHGRSIFPSGHAAFAGAIGGAFALFAWSRGLWEASVIVIAIALGAGMSRALLGAHALSDVLAGFALGGGWLLLVLVIGLPRAP
jgi:membrane-associated phospholipid phosphatase